MNDPLQIRRPGVPSIAAAPPVAEKGREPVRVSPEDLMKCITTVATNSWKMKSRVFNEKGKPREEIKKDDIKKLARHLDSIFEAFNGMGIEIRDRTNETYDYGLPDTIVSSAPRAGLSKELIVETIRPTIYWQNQIVQAGEIVIATPIEEKSETK
jgi:hypothetical protein